MSFPSWRPILGSRLGPKTTSARIMTIMVSHMPRVATSIVGWMLMKLHDTCTHTTLTNAVEPPRQVAHGPCRGSRAGSKRAAIALECGTIDVLLGKSSVLAALQWRQRARRKPGDSWGAFRVNVR